MVAQVTTRTQVQEAWRCLTWTEGSEYHPNIRDPRDPCPVARRTGGRTRGRARPSRTSRRAGTPWPGTLRHPPRTRTPTPPARAEAGTVDHRHQRKRPEGTPQVRRCASGWLAGRSGLLGHIPDPARIDPDPGAHRARDRDGLDVLALGRRRLRPEDL